MVVIYQTLLHQKLPPCDARRLDLASEAMNGACIIEVPQMLIEPGRAHRRLHLRQPQRGMHPNLDRAAGGGGFLIIACAVQIVFGHAPASIRYACCMTHTPERFEPPDMGGHELWPGALIVRHVERAGIAPLIGGGDLGDDMIGPARVPVRRRDGNDATCLKRRKPILAADDDMDRPAPKPVNYDEGAVVDVVGDALV